MSDIAVVKVTFKDEGQDFTEWYIRDGVVIDCQPFQGRIWVGSQIHNAPAINGVLDLSLRGKEKRLTLKYPIVNMETLSEAESRQVEGYYRSWLDIINQQMH
ncbi:hypothetical protein BMF90_07440 [Serratia sp. OLHL2]|uniref:hypothetical protein n=1 Tax=unclassified Serratia (in: enterobacteria) TaxID=2647522 RepID=UPI000C196931|nr:MULTISPECIES: hypothetical protein [unclassified Serratia (in: enterobacteria)]PII53771.1 hypothetical protein BMF87_08810 [Serratia sp. OLEL1]PII57853.1 hypothetical protein BMF85_12990 [Serratia sp. OLCL1]PII65099.1 hypothetical protein BMF92_06705 [Serratia sp. OLBL1]PII65571.1 hypothetical protein BMF90_07440 [Serratia sp. OLHL2]PII69810.1 hypothetical protein BMF88_23080 [Serratia sp. OLDL1]